MNFTIIRDNTTGKYIAAPLAEYILEASNHKIIKFPQERSFTINNATVNWELLKKLAGENNQE